MLMFYIFGQTKGSPNQFKKNTAVSQTINIYCHCGGTTVIDHTKNEEPIVCKPNLSYSVESFHGCEGEKLI